MNGLFWILILLGLGGRGGGTGTGLSGTPTKPRPATPLGPSWPSPLAPRPSGNPYGRNCSVGTQNPELFPGENAVQALFAEYGYPVLNPFGPDRQLGTGDANPSPVLAQFQDDYNAASGRNLLDGEAGGLLVDGLMGACTMNGLEKVIQYFTPGEWQAAIGAVVDVPGG